MKLLAVIRKSFTEQIRQFWILLLTITMAPLFVGIFYLIYKSTALNLQVSVVNLDRPSGAASSADYGKELLKYLESVKNDTIPVTFRKVSDRAAAEEQVRNKKSHAMIIIPSGFSDSIRLKQTGAAVRVPFELSGNLTETNYMISAILGITYVSGYISSVTGTLEPYHFIETPAGQSSKLNDFAIAIPGLLVWATIMLMFSGAIAFVVEPEKKTMLRLKLSRVSPLTFMAGITIIQVLVGLVSILLTLGTAYLFEFDFSGSFWLFLLVCILTCLSVIGFSLILAGLTKSVNEVLVVGNFPLFFFMFFTGTVFPIQGATLFTLGGYAFTIPGLMSTYHGTEALKQVLIYQAGIGEIWPQLVSLTGLTVVYFLIGYWIYRRRHMVVF
ncbi:MAG: ABC transporter permease [Bacteroidales bacterium]